MKDRIARAVSRAVDFVGYHYFPIGMTIIVSLLAFLLVFIVLSARG